MKSNFEHNLKKQLEERELPVSENAWDRLQEMMAQPEVVAPKTRKLNVWLPLSIAASVVLLIGIYVGLGSKSEFDSPAIATQINEKEVLQVSPKQEVINSISNEENVEINSSVSNQEAVLVKNFDTPSNSIKIEKSESKELQNSELKSAPVIKQDLTPQMLPEPEVELVHQEETQVEEKKKANFVDPEMLLYSIENNEAVKQSKSNSRLVLIDFNK